jgi:uncharacterized membrane protein YeiH
MSGYSLSLLLEHLGISVSALSGALAARGRRIDLFGILVLALVTAFGGGTVRDLMVGDLPVVWLRSPAYLLNATSVALLAFALIRLRNVPAQALLVADAFALAFFTMIGTQKGLKLHFSPSVAVLLGIVTGVAGGIIRDVLTGKVPLVFQPEIRLYATAALCGAIVYTILNFVGVPDPTATILGTITVLGLRLAGIKWGLTLPLFEPQEDRILPEK